MRSTINVTGWLAAVVLILAAIPMTYGSISVQGSDAQHLQVQNQINFSTTVANRDDVVREDLEITYELVRAADNTVVAEESSRFALAPREVEGLHQLMEIPENLFGGEYIANVVIRSPTKAPLAGFTHEFSFPGEEPAFLISEGPFLSAQAGDRQGVPVRSYGTTGANIPQDANYSLSFTLDAQEILSDDLSVRLEILPTYGNTTVHEEEKTLATSGLSEPESFNVSPNFHEPGTYQVRTHFMDGEGEALFTKTVRMVIEGKGASLLRVNNRKDTYAAGEEVGITVEYVGSADGATVVEDAQLIMEVSKDDETINTITKNIDEIGFQVETMELAYQTPQDLEEYTVLLSLRDETTVFDTVELDYEALEPNQVISEDGRIYDPNAQGCFDDGVCTEAEKEFGQCYDCLAPEEEEEPKQQKVDDALTSNTTQQGNTQPEDGGDSGILLYTFVIVLLSIIVGGILYYTLTGGRSGK